MKKPNKQEAQNQLVMSFLSVRRALGILGFLLPSSLLIYAVASGNGLEPSISDFYHTAMGDVLVGVMCAIGIFLITYMGYTPEKGDILTDKSVSTAAGIAAIGVGIFPVSPGPGKECIIDGCPTTGFMAHPQVFHFGSAFVFFVCLAIFCLKLFPKTSDPGNMSETKILNNKTYRTCGLIIVGSIVGLLVLFLLNVLGFDALYAKANDYNLIFWLEVIGVLAFAVSWLTKGETLGALRKLAPKS